MSPGTTVPPPIGLDRFAPQASVLPAGVPRWLKRPYAFLLERMSVHSGSPGILCSHGAARLPYTIMDYPTEIRKWPLAHIKVPGAEEYFVLLLPVLPAYAPACARPLPSVSTSDQTLKFGRNECQRLIERLQRLH